MRLKTRLILIFILISLVSVVTISIVSFSNSKGYLKSAIVESLNAVAEFKEGEVFLFLKQLELRAHDFGSDGFIRDSVEKITQEKISLEDMKLKIELLNWHLRVNKKPLGENIIRVSLLNLDGVVIASSDDSAIGLNKSHRPYFTYGMEKFYTSDVHMEEDGTLEIEVAVPVLTKNKPTHTIGVLVNYYDSIGVNKLIKGEFVKSLGAKAQIGGLGKTGETFLVNMEKFMISDSLFVENISINQMVDTYPVKQCLDDGKDVLGTWLDYRGVEVVGASMCLKLFDYKWVLISKQDEEEAFFKIDRLLHIFIFVGLFVLILVSIGSFFIAGRFDRMEAKIKEQNLELLRSNSDLKDFTYIVSHDLKEPLRGIYSFANFLSEDYAEKLDDVGKDYLAGLINLSNRFSDLIDSLLAYSRAGREELDFKRTDINLLLSDLLETLNFLIKEKDVDIRIASDFPMVKCDNVRLGEIFINFITNAIKYNDKLKKEVEVGFKKNFSLYGEYIPGIVYFVKDNGIGIAKKNYDQIFSMFKRFHGRDEFGGGCGSGLTIAKKLVERHGGRIWVKSKVGVGTTFYFTIS